MATSVLKIKTDDGWKDIPVLNFLSLGGGGGFSTDTHDIIMLSQIPTSVVSNVRYLWTDYKDYISDINDIDALFVWSSNGCQCYLRGVMEERTGDERTLPYVQSLYNTTYNHTTFVDVNDKNFFSFEDNGLRVFYNGNALSMTSKPAIYALVKKEA